MHRLRLLLAARPGMALWLVACVLAVRMLVPAGYMPVAGAGGIVLGLCPGSMSAPPVAHVAMPGMHHDAGQEPREEPPAGTAMPCAFAGAGLPAMDVPGAAIALPVAIFVAVPASPLVVAAPVAPAARWRPPLRAPPLA